MGGEYARGRERTFFGLICDVIISWCNPQHMHIETLGDFVARDIVDPQDFHGVTRLEDVGQNRPDKNKVCGLAWLTISKQYDGESELEYPPFFDLEYPPFTVNGVVKKIPSIRFRRSQGRVVQRPALN